MRKIYIILIILTRVSYSYGQAPIEGYEYWFNNDFANKATTTVTPTQQLTVNQSVPTTGLAEGINIFNFRSFDDLGKYSVVVSSFFYKTPISQSNTTPEIVVYEYWIDNDYANAVVVNTPIQQQVNINELIAMTSLTNGLHNFNIRFKDNEDLWSSVLSHFFYKTPQQIITQNVITEYRYWIDNDFANAVNIALTHSQQINLIDNLDLTHVPKGNHAINFQFKDTLGMWSSVLVDSIQKVALPIANFNYTLSGNCDSTVVTFTDNSIDGDTYSWSFGDGNNSNLSNPSHAFFNTGIYNVSLTVTDTLSGLDSTIVVPVSIYMKTSSTMSATECDSYTAPDGAIYTTSGVKTAVIPNSVSCDSTITINLTIKQSTTNTITETACFSYTAPDGVVYTTSGIKTATIPNAVSCDSVITINLTINNVDNAVSQTLNTLTSNAVSASYQWLDCDNGNSPLVGETNQNFTATVNGNYAVEVVQNGCIDTSNCVLINTVGIINNSFNHDVVVYPNPSKGGVNIDLGVDYKNVTIEVYDVYGKLVLSQKYQNENLIQLTLNEAPGLYFIKLQSDNYRATIRVIKQ